MTRPSVLCADGQRRHPAQDYATISPEDVAELLDDPPASPCGPHTVVSGSSELVPCPTCGLNTWDGLHRNGHRDCYMDEVPQ